MRFENILEGSSELMGGDNVWESCFCVGDYFDDRCG